jgi:tRNA threonylcarbamoyladenosine biosynthesis protein TsaB
MPNFLLLETSTDICSVAWSDGRATRALRETRVFHEHGRKLTGFIREVSEEAGYPLTALDAIGVSRGPGSFTSLRIGIATAKGLAYSLNKPLLALDAFQGMADQARQAYPFERAYYVPLVDARSMGVYLAVYDQAGRLRADVARKQLTAAFRTEVLEPGATVVFCGNAAEKYRSLFGDTEVIYAPTILPQAGALVEQARRCWEAQQFVDLAYFEPRYIAPPNITTPKKRPPHR